TACPTPNEIQEHLYRTLLTSDCSLWFSLNETGEKENCTKFWSNDILANSVFANRWKMQQLAEEVVVDENLNTVTALEPSGQEKAKLIKSRLLAENGESKKEVIHYHYANWRHFYQFPRNYSRINEPASTEHC